MSLDSNSGCLDGLGCLTLFGVGLVLAVTLRDTTVHPPLTVVGHQVFMHDASTYSVVAAEGRLTTLRGHARLLYDIPSNQAVRVTCWNPHEGTCDSLDVHVHSDGPLGAGWDYGKSGRGQTVKLP
jgi:hypothetical protein